MMDPIEQIRCYQGCIGGFTRPSLALFFKGGDLEGSLRAVDKFCARLNGVLALDARLLLESRAAPSQANLLALFARLLTALEMTAGLPSLGRCFASVQVSGGTKPVLCFESLDLNFSLACLKFIRRNLENHDESEIEVRVKALISMAQAQFAQSTNFRHLINAAQKFRTPVTLIGGKAFLLGWGRASTIINSSSTERTGAFSVSLARDKVATRNWLMRCDLPTPDQRVVNNVPEAVAAARGMGFPVVIKPRSCDGGVGVTANIHSEGDLEQAYNLAAAQGASVLVERHVTGREYRLLIVNGRLVSVHERVPAQVAGNGIDTVSQLIEQENARRLKLRKNGFSNIQLSLGDDSQACLASQGLDLEAIPAEGRQVRLRMVPKVQTGGAAVPINPHSVHPEVIAAAIKATRMMRLDIAGVDFIASDHQRSWRETGGVITEVNAIPQINRFEGFDIHGAFLRVAAPHAGRVPSMLMTDSGPQGLAQLGMILEAAQTKGLRVGLKVDKEDQERQLATKAHVITRQRDMLSILGDRQVDCIIVLQDPADILLNGFMLGYFDAAVLLPGQKNDLSPIIGQTLFRKNLGDALIYHEAIEGLDDLRQGYPPEGLQSYRSKEELVAMCLALLASEPPSLVTRPVAANRRGAEQ